MCRLSSLGSAIYGRPGAQVVIIGRYELPRSHIRYLGIGRQTCGHGSRPQPPSERVRVRCKVRGHNQRISDTLMISNL